MAVKAVAIGRTFVVHYSANGHEYLYSFADSRREEMIDELRRQSDDPEHPLTDWDFIRLANSIRPPSGMEPGGVVDATSPYAMCRVSCVATEVMEPAVESTEKVEACEAGCGCDHGGDESDHDSDERSRLGCGMFLLGFFAAFSGVVILGGLFSFACLFVYLLMR